MSSQFRTVPSLLRPGCSRSFLVVLSLIFAAGCTGGHGLIRNYHAESAGVAWFAPLNRDDGVELARWRRSVGPPVVRGGPIVTAYGAEALTVVSWNTALGGGDVPRLVTAIRQRIGPDAPLVLLLQEVYRRGADVPATLAAGSKFAGRLAATAPDGRREDVSQLASELQLGVYYVPSMRNGGPAQSDEDRGNAILSNLPLNELTAIELPFERQRRVAVAATVSGISSRGTTWSIKVVSAHLDNRVGARRGWFAGAEYARARQARGLVELLDGDMPTVLGGDFNTWFGFFDRAYIETERQFRQTRVTDTRATFLSLLRLDHLFFRLPETWRADFQRINDRFGSDHHPLVATIRF